MIFPLLKKVIAVITIFQLIALPLYPVTIYAYEEYDGGYDWGWDPFPYNTPYSESSYYSQGSYFNPTPGFDDYLSPSYTSPYSSPYSEASYYSESSYYSQPSYYSESQYYSQSNYYSESSYYSQSGYYNLTPGLDENLSPAYSSPYNSPYDQSSYYSESAYPPSQSGYYYPQEIYQTPQSTPAPWIEEERQQEVAYEEAYPPHVEEQYYDQASDVSPIVDSNTQNNALDNYNGQGSAYLSDYDDRYSEVRADQEVDSNEWVYQLTKFPDDIWSSTNGWLKGVDFGQNTSQVVPDLAKLKTDEDRENNDDLDKHIPPPSDFSSAQTAGGDSGFQVIGSPDSFTISLGFSPFQIRAPSLFKPIPSHAPGGYVIKDPIPSASPFQEKFPIRTPNPDDYVIKDVVPTPPTFQERFPVKTPNPDDYVIKDPIPNIPGLDDEPGLGKVHKAADQAARSALKLKGLLAPEDEEESKDTISRLIGAIGGLSDRILDRIIPLKIDDLPIDRADKKVIVEGLKAEGMHISDNLPDDLAYRYAKARSKLDEEGRLDNKAKQDILEIASQASLDGDNSEIPPARFNGYDLVELRGKLLDLYTNNPELAREVTKNGIAGGHGSTSASLLGVLDEGLRPQEYLEEKGILVASGEQVFGSAGLNRENVSFARWWDDDVLDRYSGKGKPVTTGDIDYEIAEIKSIREEQPTLIFGESFDIAIRNLEQKKAYLEKNPPGTSLQADLIRENFPVVYLVNGKNIDREETMVPRSSIEGEFVVKGGVDKDGISVILVPADKVSFVETQIKARKLNIKAYPAEEWFGNSKEIGNTIDATDVLDAIVGAKQEIKGEPTPQSGVFPQIRLISSAYAQIDNAPIDQRQFEYLVKKNLVKNALLKNGTVDDKLVKEIVKYKVVKPEVFRTDEGFTLFTGGDGIVEVEAELGTYSINVKPIPDIDINFPSAVGVSAGGKVIVPIAVSKGSGVVQKGDSLSYSGEQTKEEKGQIIFELFDDENGNTKLDQGEVSANIGGVKIDLIKTTKDKVIELRPGWNLITLTGIPQHSLTASAVLTEIAKQGGYAITVSSLEDGAWKTYVKRGEMDYSGDDFIIEPGKGYFIKVLKPVTFKYSGQEFVAPLKTKFTSGWNAVGLPKPKIGYNASGLIDQINGNNGSSDAISRWELSLWDTLVKQNEQKYGRDFVIENNRGYLIRSEKEGEFEF